MAKLNALFDKMETPQEGQKAPARSSVRWPFRQLAVPVKVCQETGASALIHVACRNISCGGMSFLHNAFLHKGTKLIATLPHVSGQPIEVEGTVARCSHIQGICHEIGMQFGHPINARNFLKLNLLNQGFVLEKVNPETLEGIVVYLCESETDEKFLRHFLRDTRLRVRIAPSFEEASRMLQERTDLVLAEHTIGGAPTSAYIASLRAKGQTIPAIILTLNSGDTIREEMIRAEVNAFLPKPLDQTMLLRALAEYISAGKDVGGLVSLLPQNHPNAPMVQNFVVAIHAQADEIEKSVRDTDLERTRSSILQIAGSAPSMGFPKLAQAAQLADKVLTSSMSLEESKVQIRQLILACREVSARAA